MESYEVEPGLIWARIYKSRDGELMYAPIEPPLTERDRKVLERIKEAVFSMGEPRDNVLVLRRGELDEYLQRIVRRAIHEFKIDVPVEVWPKVMYYVVRDFQGYGPLDPLLKDPFIEDIHVDGAHVPVYVWHSRWESLKTTIVFTHEELERLIYRLATLVGKTVSAADPILEGMLPEGYRLEALTDEVSARGHSMTIRKYFVQPITLIEMIRMGTISLDAVAYLWLMMDYGRNIVIVGPTGAGKTTLLNALLYLIKPNAKIVTIEDTREINIVHDHWQPLVTRPSRDPAVRNITPYDLLMVAMRSRPDYVVVGEVRGEEAYVLFQAFGSGHSGATTVHAETVEDAVRRFLTKPMNVPPMLVNLAHIFVRILRVRVGDRAVRRVTDVVEFYGLKGRRPQFTHIFRWNPDADALEKVGESRHLDIIALTRFVSKRVLEEELERRKSLLEDMVRHEMTTPYAVSRVFSMYHINPEYTLQRVARGEFP